MDKSNGLTAKSSDIKTGKTALVEGNIITGNYSPALSVTSETFNCNANYQHTSSKLIGRTLGVNCFVKVNSVLFNSDTTARSGNFGFSISGNQLNVTGYYGHNYNYCYPGSVTVYYVDLV